MHCILDDQNSKVLKIDKRQALAVAMKNWDRASACTCKILHGLIISLNRWIRLGYSNIASYQLYIKFNNCHPFFAPFLL